MMLAILITIVIGLLIVLPDAFRGLVVHGDSIGSEFVMPAVEAVQIFAADCATPKTAFNLGDTVCAKISDTNGLTRKLQWMDPCGNVRQTSAPLSGVGVTNSFTIPAADVTGDCDNRGDWQTRDLNNADSSFIAFAAFRAVDPAHAAADLGVNLSGNCSSGCTQGATRNYTFSIGNGGPDAATNVVLKVTLPPQMTFQNGSLTKSNASWNCSGPTNGVITCTLASIPAPALGASSADTFQFNATVPNAPFQTELTSVISASSDTHDLRPRSSKGSDTFHTASAVAGPALLTSSTSIIAESCPNGVIDPGETVTLHVCVFGNNQGAAQQATNVKGTLRARDEVTNPPAQVTFGTVNPNASVCADFSFTAASTECGSALFASIDFTSDQGSLGTLVFGNSQNIGASASLPFIMGKLPASDIIGNGDVFDCCGPVPSTTTISNASPASPSSFGQQVTFTATVTPSNSPLATGTVTFKDGATTLGAGTLSNVAGVATATFKTTATQLSAGAHSITASYAGDANYSSSTSAGFAYTTNKAATSTTVLSSVNPSQPGQNVTFTATVSGPAGTGVPTGSVQFKLDGSNAGAAVTLVNGSAQLSTSTLTVAGSPHAVSADYSGDTNFSASTGTLSGGQAITNSALISFTASNFAVSESAGSVTITVNRAGDTSTAVNVDFRTDDTGATTTCAPAGGNTLASSRCDFEITLGTLTFAASETSKTFIIPINRDTYVEGNETFSVVLSNPTNGAVLTTPATSTVTISDDNSGLPANAIDDTTAFVRQQYHDFLNREPDANGLAFWKNNIDHCSAPGGAAGFASIAQCLEVMRIQTSAAFFFSIEFQNSGGLVRSFYVAALDRQPAPNNMPLFLEFERDEQAVQRGVIVDPNNNAWQTILAANRDAFMKDFVLRSEFVGLYPTTDSPTTYVNKIYFHALGRTPTAAELSAAVGEFPNGATQATDPGGRGRALLRVTQAPDFQQREQNRAFVQQEYIGYLRRNPNDAPNSDFSGFTFWLTKLDNFGGNFMDAEMVKAFLSSSEYRQRFGP